MREFVCRMNQIDISISEENLLNYSQGFLDIYKNAYKLLATGSVSNSKNQLIKLVTDYNCNELEIGMINFSNKINEDELYTYIASFDADLIGINKINDQIELVEFGTKHILCPLAQNAEKFLDALLSVVQFYSSFTIDEDVSDNQDQACSVAKECSMLAGGVRYLSFYKLLIGCYS